MAQTFCAIAFVLAATSGADAQVDSTRCLAPFRFVLGTQGAFPAHMMVKAGKTCTNTFNASGRLTFRRLYLATPPGRGKVTLRQGGFFTYHAPPQAGSDSFMLRVCGRDTNLEGCADIEVRVAVTAG